MRFQRLIPGIMSRRSSSRFRWRRRPPARSMTPHGVLRFQHARRRRRSDGQRFGRRQPSCVRRSGEPRARAGAGFGNAINLPDADGLPNSDGGVILVPSTSGAALNFTRDTPATVAAWIQRSGTGNGFFLASSGMAGADRDLSNTVPCTLSGRNGVQVDDGGYIDDFAIWKSALSPPRTSRPSRRFRSRRRCRCWGLAARWRAAAAGGGGRGSVGISVRRTPRARTPPALPRVVRTQGTK
jgi:hypothetical protein